MPITKVKLVPNPVKKPIITEVSSGLLKGVPKKTQEKAEEGCPFC